MADERKIRVSCDHHGTSVTLKLTLNQKMLAKTFEQAVLVPFLKAYSKKVGDDVTLDQVARVEVDEEMLGSHSIPASVVLLKNETVDADVYLRPKEVAAAMNACKLEADPFAPMSQVLPGGMVAGSAGGRVVQPQARDLSQDVVDFDEDGLTPVERLKRERRDAREKREAAEAAAAREALEQQAAANAVLADAGGGVSEGRLTAGMGVTVEGLESEAGRQMNGMTGVLLAWKDDRQRWEVKLDAKDGTVNVKPANLRTQATRE